MGINTICKSNNTV